MNAVPLHPGGRFVAHQGDSILKRIFIPARALILLFVCALLLSPAAQAQILRVDPHVSIPDNEVFTIDIRVECAGQAVMGVETSIAFDPYLVRLDSIVPGPWFTASGEDFFFWDYTVPGTSNIHFASSLLDAESDQDECVAICYFSVLTYGQSPLIFQDVDLRNGVNDPLPFDHSTGDLIILDDAVAVESTGLGRLKALYRR